MFYLQGNPLFVCLWFKKKTPNSVTEAAYVPISNPLRDQWIGGTLVATGDLSTIRKSGQEIFMQYPPKMLHFAFLLRQGQ